ncbi:MAG: hypothetical protein DHS20C15_14330 [Planctomycetota bacterium]|nr:MAG: hypothetical protein DHS20C15_14330 [Planctomycetota bacterium]
MTNDFPSSELDREGLARLDAQLDVVRSDLHCARRDSALLETLRRRLAELHARLKTRLASEAREHADVLELEGTTLTALIERLFGDSDARLERERSEWITARLRREQIEEELAVTQEQERALAARVASQGDARERYRRLLAIKSNWLHENRSKQAERVIHLTERQAALVETVREFDEVVWAGEVAKGALSGLLHALSRAQALSAVDPLGITAVWGHQRHFEDAHRHASSANRALSRFRLELRDVRSHHGETVITAVDGFDAELYDEIVDDWVISPRVDRSHAKVSITRTRLSRALRALLLKRRDLRRELELVRGRRTRLESGE